MKERTFIEAMKYRRSYYKISDQSPLSDQEIEDLVNSVVTHVPSAFNSQSSRVVLLLGEHHRKLWDIAKQTLKKIISEEAFKNTEAKIDNCFACGYATLLFFEDMRVVKKLQDAFPTYTDNFPVWAEHTSAMHQFALWTLLEDVGFGASLQHYNPLIDQEVKQTWNIPEEWKLVAQMPFGTPVEEPGEKEFGSLAERVKVFK